MDYGFNFKMQFSTKTYYKEIVLTVYIYSRTTDYPFIYTTCITSFINTIAFSSVSTHLTFFPVEKSRMQIFQY